MKNNTVKSTMFARWLLPFCLLALAPSFTGAQTVRRGNCTPVFSDSAATARSQVVRRLPTINKKWDASKVYRQLVILVSYSDTDFSMDDPLQFYNAMFNDKDFSQRQGTGCVADYYREQSGGLFNMQFDVFGPYKIDSKAQPYENPTATTQNYGRNQMTAATKLFLAEHPDMDFSLYDWNNNGNLNQVIYIFAGTCGNQGNEKYFGYIWPNTSTFSAITTPDGKKISDYTCSAELWGNGTSCGIGTICHEFTHSLGLPDIYPTSSNDDFSVVDEWDLMDGGNFTNYGSCPPNFTPLEKMLLGWLTPTELTEPKTVERLKPVNEGGEVYIVKNTKAEYYLLENRQRMGWDKGIPGSGLVIYHVNYKASAWTGNTVNSTKGANRFDLVHADNMDYNAWDDFLYDSGAKSQYANAEHMNNLHLSGSAYPFAGDEGNSNNELTDTSVPAATVFNNNADGNKFMSKPITEIKQHSDGTVSFLFMGGDSIHSGIVDSNRETITNSRCYDMQGRQVAGHDNAFSRSSGKSLYLVRKADGTIRKVLR